MAGTALAASVRNERRRVYRKSDRNKDRRIGEVQDQAQRPEDSIFIARALSPDSAVRSQSALHIIQLSKNVFYNFKTAKFLNVTTEAYFYNTWHLLHKLNLRRIRM